MYLLTMFSAKIRHLLYTVNLNPVLYDLLPCLRNFIYSNRLKSLKLDYISPSHRNPIKQTTNK